MKLIKNSLIIALLSLVVCLKTEAQVGIGTTNPQQDLHIIGDGTETIRVDGLSATNISNNFGTNSSLPVHVNANGDMIIPPSPSSVAFAFNGTDIINTGIFVQTGFQGQSSGVIQLYKTPSFTLTQPALVMITYSMSAYIFNRAGTATIDDGKPKLINNFFYVGNGTTADTSIAYGRTSINYSNNAPSIGNWITNGILYATAVDSVYLPAGTYSIHLCGLIAATTGASPLLSSDSFSTSFGDTAYEYLKVITFY